MLSRPRLLHEFHGSGDLNSVASSPCQTLYLLKCTVSIVMELQELKAKEPLTQSDTLG